jgi:tryptophanyl-tRNA synthetase
MSKSDPDPRSRILLTDSAAEIRQKITAARTDSVNAVSFDRAARPGVSNLLELWACFDSSRRGPEALAAELAAAGASLRDLKDGVGKVLAEEIPVIGERYRMFLEKDGGDYLDEVQAVGAVAARRNAEGTMEVVRRAVWLSS